MTLEEAIDRILPAASSSPRETAEIGVRIGRLLPAGTIVALFGDLGAGKTHLARGIVEGLGGDPDAVTSPTFTIVQEYPVADGRVYHVDTYRLHSASEFAAVGADDILFGGDRVIIEWPELLEPLPAGTLRLRLTHDGSPARRIERVDR